MLDDRVTLSVGQDDGPRELFTFTPLASYSTNPSFLNVFMKKLTRGRLVPTISASISRDTSSSTRRCPVVLPYWARNSGVLAHGLSAGARATSSVWRSLFRRLVANVRYVAERGGL